MTETQLSNNILELLSYHGAFAWKNHSVGIYDAKIGGFRSSSKHAIKGVSDIICNWNKGIVDYIEVKKPAKKARTQEQLTNLLRPEQRIFRDTILTRGGNYYVFDDVYAVKDWVLRYRNTQC